MKSNNIRKKDCMNEEIKNPILVDYISPPSFMRGEAFTLRDLFAAFIITSKSPATLNTNLRHAIEAYELADAMLEARESK